MSATCVDETARVRAALAVIPADDYGTWVDMAFALKHGFGDAGFDIWDEWSRTAGNYNERCGPHDVALGKGVRRQDARLAVLARAAARFRSEAYPLSRPDGNSARATFLTCSNAGRARRRGSRRGTRRWRARHRKSGNGHGRWVRNTRISFANIWNRRAHCASWRRPNCMHCWVTSRRAKSSRSRDVCWWCRSGSGKRSRRWN